jgi:citrate lyase beta subunit
MDRFKYISLGATLFVPSTHKALKSIVLHKRYPDLKSVLIDTEDGIEENSLEYSLSLISELLLEYEKEELLVFIRPRNSNVLERLLHFDGIEKIEGFILPKFSLENQQKYLALLKNHSFSFMPSIEGEELFSWEKLHTLLDILLPYKEQIPLVRFGLEDMLRQLKMKRSCNKTIFDYSVTSFVLGQFLSLFKSAGFAVSGGVYPCFRDDEGFLRDTKRDLEEGLFSKTIIHPRQITLAHHCYKVSQSEYKEALAISSENRSVFNFEDTMAETKTMLAYAQEILKREEVYGIIEP